MERENTQAKLEQRDSGMEWEGKYEMLVQAQNVLVDIHGAKHQAPQQLDSWNSHELYGQSQVSHQLDGWRPGEMEGTEVF